MKESNRQTRTPTTGKRDPEYPHATFGKEGRQARSKLGGFSNGIYIGPQRYNMVPPLYGPCTVQLHCWGLGTPLTCSSSGWRGGSSEFQAPSVALDAQRLTRGARVVEAIRA